MADHHTQSFHISPHTVLFDLKRSSSPLSIVACFDLDEPSRSDDKLMVGREGSKHGKCGTQSRTLSDHLVIDARDNEPGCGNKRGCGHLHKELRLRISPCCRTGSDI